MVVGGGTGLSKTSARKEEKFRGRVTISVPRTLESERTFEDGYWRRESDTTRGLGL